MPGQNATLARCCPPEFPLYLNLPHQTFQPLPMQNVLPLDRQRSWLSFRIGDKNEEAIAVMYTIDIDVGGTLTDGLFGDGQTLAAVKVDTTPHDLTVCFMDCLQAGTDELGFDDSGALLAQTQLIRWSTTITTNVLAERRGPRLGLFVSKGEEHSLYSGHGSNLALELVGEDNVIGLTQPVDPQAVLGLVKSLLERGVRRVCISLTGAFSNAKDEAKLKQVIEQQYPDHYLGAVPVLLGSDICKHPDDMTRTHYALINAYVHGPLADTLFKAEDKLRDQFGWKRQLLIGHQNGGVARVAKTRAVDTIESGPTMGLFASADFAASLQSLRGVPKVSRSSITS